MVNQDIFYNAIVHDITAIRGDTIQFNFIITGLRGSRPNTVVFKAKEHYDDETPVFVCEVGNGVTYQSYDSTSDTITYAVRVEPTKTQSLDLARYYYSLDITANDDVVTLLKGRLILDYDVRKGV